MLIQLKLAQDAESIMNEFTKDELQILYKCIRLAEIDHGECPDLDNVKFKIQSMMDNYDKQSTKCPKCSNIRVSDGMCWNMGCDYRE